MSKKEKKKNKISDQKFIEAVASASSIHQALQTMGLSSKGRAYFHFKMRCEELNLELPIKKNSQKELRLLIKDEELIEACKSRSRRQTILLLGLNYPVNSNNKWLKAKIKELKIDTSHWVGQEHLKGKTHNWGKKIPLEQILVENSSYSSTVSLKGRLLKEGLLKYECYICGINSWLNDKLSLQLDHINGNNKDNRLSNLRLLCPNCHSQTETFCRQKQEQEH